MYYLLWNYTVKNTSKQEFEEEYGRQGTWFKFFEKCNDYMGLELLQDRAASDNYMLVDKWTSREAYDTFIDENRGEYDLLSKRFLNLHLGEESGGTYNLIEP